MLGFHHLSPPFHPSLLRNSISLFLNLVLTLSVVCCAVRLSEVCFSIPLLVGHLGLDLLSEARKPQLEEWAGMKGAASAPLHLFIPTIIQPLYAAKQQ